MKIIEFSEDDINWFILFIEANASHKDDKCYRWKKEGNSLIDREELNFEEIEAGYFI